MRLITSLELRIRPDLQHFEIVVGFEHQAVSFPQMGFSPQLGQIAEVRDNRDFQSMGAKCESQRVHGIVWNREGRDFDVTHDESLAGANVFHAIQALRSFGQDAHHFSVRGFVQIDGGAPLAQHLCKRADVIAVFVGDDDAVEPVNVAANRGKAPQRFFCRSPASTSSRVWSVPYNVQLPELPEPRIVTRRLINFRRTGA